MLCLGEWESGLSYNQKIVQKAFQIKKEKKINAFDFKQIQKLNLKIEDLKKWFSMNGYNV